MGFEFAIKSSSLITGPRPLLELNLVSMPYKSRAVCLLPVEFFDRINEIFTFHIWVHKLPAFCQTRMSKGCLLHFTFLFIPFYVVVFLFFLACHKRGETVFTLKTLPNVAN